MSLPSRRKVLIIEDEGIVALNVSQLVESFGYEVVGHTGVGEESIELAKATDPDLIFMDINLKGKMDGITAAQAIGESCRAAIVFLTAHAEEETLQRAKLVNPFGYIIKPFEEDELRVAAQLALQRLDADATRSRTSIDPGEEIHELSDYAVSDNSKIEEVLAEIEQLNSLSKNSSVLLADKALRRTFESGTFLFSNSEKFCFIVLTGRLSVIRSTEGGKDLVVDLLSAGDLGGLVTPFDNTDYLIKAQTDCKLLLIPIATLKQLISKDAELANLCFNIQSDRCAHLSNLALSLAHSRVESRIVHTLVALSTKLGKKDRDGLAIRIFITRKELADLTGTTPETAIRVTKSLERSELLDLSRPGIIKIPSIPRLKQAAQ